MGKKKKEIRKASDLLPDIRNANRGTIRGAAMVEESLERNGAGRSVLADKHGVLIAGNKTANAFIEAGHEDIIVVPTDGTKLVVVMRTDLDLSTDPRARELAHADNRSAQVSLDWDTVTLAEDSQNKSLDLSWMWRNDELDSAGKSIFGEDKTAFLGEDDEDEHFDGENTRGERNEGTVEVVVLCNSEAEANRARREIQEMGFYVK